MELVFHRNISLDDNLKDISTLPTFKKHIFSKLSIAHVPPYFIVGNRYMSVLHARLRNKCSGLNSGLFRNHIRNNPICDLCDVVEDAYHYFFQCRKYTVERQVNDTVRGFHPLNINVILNGNENWNTEVNVVLFRAVHRYIHVSKRF